MEDKRTRIDMKDFYLIAFLLAEGGAIIRSRKDDTDPDGRRKIFTIETPVDYDQKLRDFRNHRAKVNVRKFIEAVRDLKKQIHEDPL
jgi:hypothetical protein